MVVKRTQPKPPCSIADCDSISYMRQMCCRHYQGWHSTMRWRLTVLNLTAEEAVSRPSRRRNGRNANTAI